MKPAPIQVQAAEFLALDPLRNIASLKVLELYLAHATVHCLSVAGHSGVLIYYPPSTTSFDRNTYQDCRAVALLTAQSLEVAGRLLELLPEAPKYVFKVGGDFERGCTR